MSSAQGVCQCYGHCSLTRLRAGMQRLKSVLCSSHTCAGVMLYLREQARQAMKSSAKDGSACNQLLEVVMC